MYTKGISMNFCSSEMGTTIFAYINLIISVLASVISTLGFIYVVTNCFFINWSKSEEFLPTIIAGCILVVVMLLSYNTTVFAGFLFAGVSKKKPEYIKAYYVFGVIITCLILFSTFIAFFIPVTEVQIKAAPISLLICVIYCLILAMIRRTYINYETLNAQFNHSPLPKA